MKKIEIKITRPDLLFPDSYASKLVQEGCGTCEALGKCKSGNIFIEGWRELWNTAF